MPKRKNAPKAPPASVEDRRERNLRVVHREEMKTTVGDVLEHLHTDAAIELLYAQDNLAAGRPLNDLSALKGDVDVAHHDESAEQLDAAKVEAPFETAPPTTDHAKTGTPMENLAAAVVVEAGSLAAEAAAAVGVVKAAASTIAGAVNDSVAASKAHVADAARERARDENAAEARADRVEEPATPLAAKPTSLLRFLSPRFVIKATRDAVGELIGGVRQARSELRNAGERARACFGGAAVPEART